MDTKRPTDDSKEQSKSHKDKTLGGGGGTDDKSKGKTTRDPARDTSRQSQNEGSRGHSGHSDQR
jgi:hypothetical protein